MNQIFQNKISRKTRDYTNVLDREWDNLIILDACRHDHFEDVIGESNFIYSVGSNSANWRDNTFGSGNFSDIVYVSANPHISNNRAEKEGFSFHEIKDVWKYGWNEEKQTVLPERMLEETIKASEEYPEKKIISHFMQPHAPYLGEHGWDPHYRNVWDDVRARKVSKSKAEKALKENLDLTYSHVSKLSTEIQGKTVITSDHGEMLGEREGYMGMGQIIFITMLLGRFPGKL